MALWLIISGTVGSPPPETARVEKNKLRLFKQQTELVIEKNPNVMLFAKLYILLQWYKNRSIR